VRGNRCGRTGTRGQGVTEHRRGDSGGLYPLRNVARTLLLGSEATARDGADRFRGTRW
jgi:hypothetical protein